MMYANAAVMDEQPQCPQELVDWVREACRRSFKFARENLKKVLRELKRIMTKMQAT